MVLILNCFAQDVNTYIPPRAKQYLPILVEEIDKNWNDLFEYGYMGALIEHESCISLTHSRCWSPTSKLSTKRELGIGFGQITKAYREDGSIRFDALQEMKELHNQELRDLSWNNIENRPDLQFRTIVLKSKDNWKKFPTVADPVERLRFTDAAYNAGAGAIINRRRSCSLSPRCDPNKFIGHVEKMCTANKVIYGNRSACDINSHHVHDVTNTRLPKYKAIVKSKNK